MAYGVASTAWIVCIVAFSSWVDDLMAEQGKTIGDLNHPWVIW